MKRSWISLVAAVALIASVGCGGSGTVETAAEKDELSEWVADNPAPEEAPLEGENE